MVAMSPQLVATPVVVEKFFVRPAVRKPFYEVQRIFAVLAQGLVNVWRIETDEVYLGLEKHLVEVLPVSLAFLAVIEDERADTRYVVDKAFFELLEGVQPFAVAGRGCEIAFRGHLPCA